MKRLTILVFLLIYSLGWTQETKPPRREKPKKEELKRREKPPVDEQVKRLILELNLNELKQLQVRQILLDQEKRSVDFNPENNEDKKPSREEMETRIQLEESFLDQKMKKILTPAQFIIWSEKKINETKRAEKYK